MSKWTPLRQAQSVLTLALLFISTLSATLPPATAVHLDYVETIVASDWVEAGQALNLNADDGWKNLTLPFPFDFYGTDYSQIWVSTNGMVSLNRTFDPSYADSEAALAARLLIAPLWDDYQTFSTTRTDLDVFAGSIDSTHFIVRWKAVLFSQESEDVNFEVVLGQDGIIRFNYGPSTATSLDATVGVSNGLGRYFFHSVLDSNNINSYLYTPSTLTNAPVIIMTISPQRPWMVGETITFNASASYDPNGTIVSYQWSFGDGAAATTPIATHQYTAPGSYEVRITLRDNDGVQSINTITGQVVRAAVGLLDTWPETRTVNLANRANVTLHAEAVNIQSFQPWVRIVFEARNLKTRTSTTLYSETLQLSTRQQAVFNATLTPENTSSRYLITVTLQITSRDPGLNPQPGWFSIGTFSLRMRVVAS